MDGNNWKENLNLPQKDTRFKTEVNSNKNISFKFQGRHNDERKRIRRLFAKTRTINGNI